ncbi:hypothetical protein RFI_23395 [Reticulomyxa filosa]|uniref:Uncharacterized protein n=1 Tax=Reticulomyxa filosa TaxID=46433 RepID=X6MLM7_RETFI|nr:hypothetical protein RFI_23395 [Reticulomyxa filosa]|eukprot:ETO13970.1 hypothetical protein RFI_23395 [Reticulomyxa filosa]
MQRQSNQVSSPTSPVSKRPPKFVKIKDLTPTSGGFSLIGKIVFEKKILDRLNIDGTRKCLVEFLIGDSTGCVMLTLRNEQISNIKVGEVLILRNARVHMLFQGYMRVVIDKWGAIDKVPSSSMSDDINFECNKSDVEYTLQSPKEHARATRENNYRNRKRDRVSHHDTESTSKQQQQQRPRIVRKLHSYEQLLSHTNVTTYSGKEFVEIVTNKDDTVPLKYATITDEKEFEDEEFWIKTMDTVANGAYDHETGTCFLELYSNPGLTKHCLIGVVNHAHMDARGNFCLYDSIFTYLGQIVDHQTKMKGNMKDPFGFISVRCRRPFVDILSRIFTNYEKDPNRYHMPQLHEEYVKPLPSKPRDKDQSPIGKISFHTFEWDAQSTEEFRLACRKHGATVQGAFSAACIVAVCCLNNFQSQEPTKIRLIVPCQMSPHVDPPVNSHDCVCGAAALVFEVSISLGNDPVYYTKIGTPLWELVQSCHKEMQESVASGCTFEWISAINGKAFRPSGEKITLPMVTTMCSSIGVNCMRANYGEGIEIKGVKMVGSAYKGNVSATHASTMAHVHVSLLVYLFFTFDGRLNVSIEYNSPGLSEEEATKYCSAYHAVLKTFLKPETDHPLSIGDILKKFGSNLDILLAQNFLKRSVLSLFLQEKKVKNALTA